MNNLMGRAEPERIPLSVLLSQICENLYPIFEGHGYQHIGFTLIAHDLVNGEGGASGNLKPNGIKAILEDCLERMNKADGEKQEPMQ